MPDAAVLEVEEPVVTLDTIRFVYEGPSLSFRLVLRDQNECAFYQVRVVQAPIEEGETLESFMERFFSEHLAQFSLVSLVALSPDANVVRPSEQTYPGQLEQVVAMVDRLQADVDDTGDVKNHDVSIVENLRFLSPWG